MTNEHYFWRRWGSGKGEQSARLHHKHSYTVRLKIMQTKPYEEQIITKGEKKNEKIFTLENLFPRKIYPVPYPSPSRFRSEHLMLQAKTARNSYLFLYFSLLR